MSSTVYYFWNTPADPLATAHLRGPVPLSEVVPNLNDLVEVNLAGGTRLDEQLDLLIVEDGFDDLTQSLLPSALSVEEFKSIGVCSSLQALNRLVTVLQDAPKVLTLDFELKTQTRFGQNAIPEMHRTIKELLERPKWQHTVIVGITYHSREVISRELLLDLHSRGHSVFQKSAYLTEVLPDILWDALGRYSVRVRLDAFQSIAQSIKSEEPKGAASKQASAAFVGLQSPQMKTIVEEISRISHLRRVPVLLLGESGVGKTTIARELLNTEGPFVEVNCSAIPENLLESELFGHAKGSFTNAIAAKEGLFEAADGGTLFLDEIGILPYQLQGKLLTAVVDQEIRRVGETRTRRLDVRIVAATNEDLPAKVQAKEFRADLFFRFEAFTFRIPSLRERPEDIPVLIHSLLDSIAREYKLLRPQITEDAVARLVAHQYEGNVWELRNRLTKLVAKYPHTITLPNVEEVLTVSGDTFSRSSAVSAWPSYSDGLDYLRVRVDEIEGCLQKGYTPFQIGSAVFPNSRKHPTQRLGGFWRQETTVRLFTNMPPSDVQARWPKVLENLRVKRGRMLTACNYPQWMLPVVAVD